MKPEPKHMHTAWLCWLIAAAIFVTFLTGCERVTEYRCDAQQIEKARAQFMFCKEGNPDFTRDCWHEAAKAHCTITAEFHRTEIVKPEN